VLVMGSLLLLLVLVLLLLLMWRQHCCWLEC
jgi:hypothetical protein